MRNKFDMQLELLNEQLTRMGELCELAINRVTKALVEGNLEQAKKVMAADEEIDQMEKDIERLCLKLLLQQQPVARDLRQISAALKMITDMERIGDQTADIAEIIISAGMSEAGDVKKIEEMSAGVARMVNDSVTAYVERDLELARKVMEADDNIDKLFDEIRASIIKLIAEGNKGEQGVDLVMISKYLERIGDHATNIAEWVEFSITGVHKGAQAVEA
ncbi:phosphate signaling complex protein PhoU [Faecalicatena contorta]|uniref:phosphate signaling complex protein PhoU n=1 Tax=Faecalicatena contorta TaxID=39482 RepID=UPI00195F2E71|nr:phosphate signaling complex protein PhoU [Faecalicatena contorta]MBM6686752.1 phosphate signaling complex protein PhoU [Faecalicatena contorta]MBM6712013.1 phosphate signaling complex protein PhoU [Faecalicatena contorta]